MLGNYPESGTVIIEKLGEEHEKTGKPIVYTSSDSVFQIAANIDVIPLERLYDICAAARRLLQGEWACGRVIARPYRLINGKRERTPDRRDYAVSPPEIVFKTIALVFESIAVTETAIGYRQSTRFRAMGICATNRPISCRYLRNRVSSTHRTD